MRKAPCSHARKAIGLRSLLATLALSVLALPLALGFLVASLVSGGINEQPINRFAAVSREVHKAVRVDARGGLSSRADYLPPAWLSLVLADAGDRVFYSNQPDLPVGSIVDRNRLARDAQAAGRWGAPGSAPQVSGGPPSCIYLETIEHGGRVIGSYYAILPPVDLRKLEGRDFTIYRPLVLGGIALFAIIAGAVVAAGLAGAVMRLERAAGRIAAGDLETVVQEKGVREISALAGAMDRMRQGLREDRDRRARFLAAVSHDLRTPLTSIGGYLEAVEDGLADNPDTLRRYVSIMQSKAGILESRIQELLEFARMETGEWRFGFELLELGPFLDNLAREFLEDALLEGRRLECDLAAASGLVVEADPALFRRVLENILSNALRYGPPDGAVRFGARRVRAGELAGGAIPSDEGPSAQTEATDAFLLIEIDDEGPGIPEAERSRIFEPFYRGSGAREADGSGLGLYIARSVVRGHGWDLRVSDAPSGGARFILVLPIPPGASS
jgi:signal transduction histidine kinase